MRVNTRELVLVWPCVRKLQNYMGVILEWNQKLVMEAAFFSPCPLTITIF